MPLSKRQPPSYPSVGPRTLPNRDHAIGPFAVALGGLAGNNSHGAGVLEALYRSEKKPKLITCTSGQIRYTYAYLSGLKPESRLNPHGMLQEHFASAQPFGEATDHNLNYKILTWLTQRIRPSVPELSQDIAANVTRSIQHFFANPRAFSLWTEWYKLMPARSLVSQDLMLDPNVFSDMAAVFNDDCGKDGHGVGVIFNAYDFVEGHEYIFLNSKAAELTGHPFGSTNRNRPWVQYREITPKSVQEALRLYEYGFGEPGNLIDGAYLRSVILSEIPHQGNGISQIIVGRPLASKWLGDAPMSLVELKDMQTEVSFHGCYLGEKGQIELINQLIETNYPLNPPPGVTPIEILEVEIEQQRGWWDYVLESQKVFDSAFHRTTDKICPRLHAESQPAVATEMLETRVLETV